MFTLQRYALSPDNALDSAQNTWPLRIVAMTTDPTPVAAKIFVMHADTSDDLMGDAFSCVASLPQMTELPADAETPGVPFFRTHDVTIHARSADHAVEFWSKIQDAVRDLADNIQAATALELQETITITPSNA